MMPARRFPPPWPIEEYDACYIVKDRNAQALADVYYENEPGRRTAANLLTRDEARRIAANIAKLPDLLREPARPQRRASGLRRSAVDFQACQKASEFRR